jgi:acyl carrier protein
MDDPLFGSIQEIVARIAGPGRTPGNLSRDTPLAGGFWLDSVELLEVIIACEHTFEIAFDGQEDLEPGRFGTLGSLTDAVRDKMADAGR